MLRMEVTDNGNKELCEIPRPRLNVISITPNMLAIQEWLPTVRTSGNISVPVYVKAF